MEGAESSVGKAKKRSELNFLTDVRSSDHWQRLIQRKGLIMVDVYVDWAGPCLAMGSVLKRIKVEVNDELLHFAQAAADLVPELFVFAHICRPNFLFVANKRFVGLVKGANGPLLARTAHALMENERAVLAGHKQRCVIDIEEALKKRSSDVDILDEFEDDLEDVKSAKVEEEKPSRHFTLLLTEPYIAVNPKYLRIVEDTLRQHGLTVMRSKECLMGEDDLVTFGPDINKKLLAPLFNSRCLIMLLRCEESQRASGLVNTLLGDVDINNTLSEGNNTKNQQKSLRERCYDEQLYHFGFLCPDQHGFLVLMDKFFMEPTHTRAIVLAEDNFEAKLSLESHGMLINHLCSLSKSDLGPEQLQLLNISDNNETVDEHELITMAIVKTNPNARISEFKATLGPRLLLFSSESSDLENLETFMNQRRSEERRASRRQSEQIGGLLKILVDQG